jgi:hypothetical protein
MGMGEDIELRDMLHTNALSAGEKTEMMAGKKEASVVACLL